VNQTPDPADPTVEGEADASVHDDLAVNTDATPGPEDGDQSDVSQEPTAEHEVQDTLAGAA
jgi:hypothetical protein